MEIEEKAKALTEKHSLPETKGNSLDGARKPFELSRAEEAHLNIWDAENATAEQRAEAYLRVKNLWRLDE